jgi:hypothetical protein
MSQLYQSRSIKKVIYLRRRYDNGTHDVKRNENLHIEISVIPSCGSYGCYGPLVTANCDKFNVTGMIY